VSDFSRNRPNAARFSLAAVAMAAMLAGCATPKSALLPDIDDWGARTTVLAGLDEWEFSGRIAVKTATDGFNGKLRWSQDKNEFQVTASGPLGAGAVRIEGDRQSVVLTDKNGVQTELKDAELEFRYRYGWTIPVTSLRYWALGIPDPSSAAETVFNDAGELESLTQRDWSVTFSRYAEGGGQLMPKVLTAENSDTRVRLVIDYWIFFD
jgi:outer membrane lipoprotein LolB